MESEVSEAFKRISPFCSKLVRSQKVDDVILLQNALVDVDKVSFQMLQEYLLFPFRLILKKETMEDMRIHCLECLKFIFDNTVINSRDLFYDLFLQTFKFGNSRDVSEFHKPSEELKYAICECVRSLLNSSSPEIYEFVYSLEFCPVLGHSLFALLALLKQEKSKVLCFSVLKTISALLYCSTDYRFSVDKRMIIIAGDRLAAFLPGIAQGLWAVISADPKQGHMIIVTALNIWKEFITMTMGDCYIKDGDDKQVFSNASSQFVTPPCVVRSNLWARETSLKIEILSRIFSKLVCHDHWRVRRSLTECMGAILLKCTNSLQNCIPILLDSLFALSVDSYVQVSTVGGKAIEEFAHHVEKTDSKSVRMIAEDDILRLSNKLIKTHLMSNDSEFLGILRTLHGYLQMLSTSVVNVLRSPPHLNRLLLSLLHITELDCSEVNLLSETTVSLNFGAKDVMSLWPKKSFKNFQDPEVMLRVSSICEVLGSCSDVRLLVDYLLEKFSNHEEYRNQAALLILLTIKGLSKGNLCITEKCHISDLIGDILEELLLPKYWMLQGNGKQAKGIDERKSFAEMNASVVQVCFLLEAVATFSLVLGPDFCPFLLCVLCPVMEKAGSPNLIVSQTGKTALSVIACSCGFKSIEEMILQNSDYLVNSVTINFQQYIHRPEVGVVLRVVLDHCNVDILPLFRDPIYKLLNILDYNVEVREFILQILNSVVVAIKSMVKNQNVCKQMECESKPSVILETQHHLSLKCAILQYHDMNKTEDSNYVDTSSQEFSDSTEDMLPEASGNNDGLNSQDASSKPFHVDLVVKILERCVHLQSSKNLTLCLLSLDTIASGIVALSDFQEELLPLVHKLWSPLVLRFGRELVVSMQAFRTLVVIANECGDFVRSRTLKDVWPHLLSFLEGQRSRSLGKGDASPYRYTHTFKYQKLILSEIGHLVKKLDISEKDIEPIALGCLAYLDKNQPVLLQKAAFKAIQDISCLNPDAIWFYFKEAFSNTKQIPSHVSLQTVQFCGYAHLNHPQDLQLHEIK